VNITLRRLQAQFVTGCEQVIGPSSLQVHSQRCTDALVLAPGY
ncbi:hypothetical protein P3T40_009154, partial [Paraburkholderia sp. EB58]